MDAFDCDHCRTQRVDTSGGYGLDCSDPVRAGDDGVTNLMRAASTPPLPVTVNLKLSAEA